MRKTIILSLFVCITISLRGQTQYRLWIDGQTEQTVAGTATPTAHVDLDVSALSNGLHQLFIAMCDDKGLPVDQQSRIFLKTSTDETLLYRYWFDDDTEGEQTGTITNSAYLNLDVSALSNGIHILNFVLSDLSQTILGQQSSLFVKVSTGGIVRYEYFVNNLDTPVGGETLSSPTIPYHLMADLDVSGVTPAPLRSDNFYFFIDEGQAVVMAKNDIYFRFYDEDYNYIEDAAQYADLSTSEDVVAEQLESKVTKRADIPAPEKISWFKAEAEAGDSVLFKVNVPATMKLFAPDGTELMLTEEKEIRLRLADEGTYYLAVYDAKAGSTSKMDVYFELVDATGINGITGNQPDNASIYNLSGVRVVSPPRKGIYIINSKKVSIK